MEPAIPNPGADEEPDDECPICGKNGVSESNRCPQCKGAAEEARARYGYVPF